MYTEECIALRMRAKQVPFVRIRSLLAVRDNSLSSWDIHLYPNSLILEALLAILSHDLRRIS